MSSWHPYEVKYKPRAVKDLAKLGKNDGERVRRAISFFAQTSRGDIKLIDRGRRYWEIRVGLHFRAAFQFEDGALSILRVWRKG